MKVVLKETVTRFKTIEVSNEFKGMDGGELEDTVVFDEVYDAVAHDGWDVEYTHEASISEGQHDSTIFYNG